MEFQFKKIPCFSYDMLNTEFYKKIIKSKYFDSQLFFPFPFVPFIYKCICNKQVYTQ